MKSNQGCCHFVMATDDNNNDNPNHEKNSIEFPNMHERKNPAIHQEKSRSLSFNLDFSSIVMATDDTKLKPVATDDNKLKQNNKVMLAGRP